jgi:inosose dehydratase
MKIAYTGWTWLINHKDNYRFEFEQFLKEVSQLGYEAVENFAFIKGYFDGDAAEVKRLLDQYGLEMANLYLHYSDDPEADYQKAEEYAEFMVAIGATYMNLQGVMWHDAPNNRPTDRDKVLGYAALSNKIGALCASKGLVACFHPHANTPVYTQEQIDLFCEMTDPALVTLCLDTAHTTLAGMDAVEAFDHFGPRIGYVHLKDVDPDESVSPEWPMARFLPLGWGTVDFKGVVKALKNGGYDGVLCVELDKQPVCNYHSAMVSRAYLRGALGL